jgi:hypothetical protein
MTTPATATAMRHVLVRHADGGRYYRTAPETRAAHRMPGDETARWAATVHDDTGGCFFYDLSQLAMPTAAPVREPGRMNIDPIQQQSENNVH